jgi:hypothetical protein
MTAIDALFARAEGGYGDLGEPLAHLQQVL